MAQKTKAAPVEKARKPKSAKQLARKAANIAAYEQRCAALKAGTFKGVMEQAAEAAARSAAERQAETERCRSIVVAHCNHPTYGSRLSKWLNGSKADPVRLANVVIPTWLKTQGIVVEHVAPTT